MIVLGTIPMPHQAMNGRGLMRDQNGCECVYFPQRASLGVKMIKLLATNKNAPEAEISPRTAMAHGLIYYS